MRTRILRLVSAAVAALVLTGCSGSGHVASDVSTAPTRTAPRPASTTKPAPAYPKEFHSADRAAFYTPPSPVPSAAPGTLLRYERAHFEVRGGVPWKVMYASRALTGKPIVVTGVVIVPAGTAPAGGWKLLSVAHGTTGVADGCTPSAADLHGNPADAPYPLNLSTRDLYDRIPTSGYLAHGYVVASTDYEGLGTPGLHPYLVGQSEGRGVLDIARAARQLPGVSVGKRFAIWGYSQGGHAAAWANDLAATWTPELDLVGTVSGAPVSELNVVFQELATTSREPALFFTMVAGFVAAYPELRPSDILTPAGLAVLKKADAGCNGLKDAVRGKPLSSLVRPGLAQAKDWQSRLGENNPGRPDRPRVRPPILLLHSAADKVVPQFLSDVMYQRMCGLGQVVESRVYHRGEDHVPADTPAITDGRVWIEGLWSGRTKAVSTCPKT